MPRARDCFGVIPNFFQGRNAKLLRRQQSPYFGLNLMKEKRQRRGKKEATRSLESSKSTGISQRDAVTNERKRKPFALHVKRRKNVDVFHADTKCHKQACFFVDNYSASRIQPTFLSPEIAPHTHFCRLTKTISLTRSLVTRSRAA